MEPLESDILTRLLPGYSISRIVSSRDPIHHAYFSAVLVDSNAVPTHLQSDEDVSRFLHEASDAVNSEAAALDLIRAFADLRSYRILDEHPGYADAQAVEDQAEKLSTDYLFGVETSGRHWHIHVTLFTDDYSGSVYRYAFTVFGDPGSGVRIDEKTLILLRNYVY